ncbi:Flagellum-specific ATP synthase [bioreactor metagenome]|uniref:Flagellum-specific ATP synthase n=1 Tax=bioreactor metagenome TaxID=1076179 RepID=A0A645JCH9_9ZZZZ
MDEIVDREHVKLAARLRRTLSVYDDNFDLISIGAYKTGANPLLDEAVAKMDRINDFLTQEVSQRCSYEETLSHLAKIME